MSPTEQNRLAASGLFERVSTAIRESLPESETEWTTVSSIRLSPDQSFNTHPFSRLSTVRHSQRPSSRANAEQELNPETLSAPFEFQRRHRLPLSQNGHLSPHSTLPDKLLPKITPSGLQARKQSSQSASDTTRKVSFQRFDLQKSSSSKTNNIGSQLHPRVTQVSTGVESTPSSATNRLDTRPEQGCRAVQCGFEFGACGYEGTEGRNGAWAIVQGTVGRQQNTGISRAAFGSYDFVSL